MPISLIYIANARIPTERAHGYQIMQMCQAFDEIGTSTVVLKPFRVNTAELQSVDPQTYYSLRRRLQILDLWSVDWLPYFQNRPLRRFEPLAFFLQIFTFGLSLWAYLRPRKGRDTADGILFLRDINLTALLQTLLPSSVCDRLIVEVHSLSEVPWRRQRQGRILGGVAGVVCLTSAMRDHVVALGVPRENVLVAHDAVDLESFDKRISQAEARSRLGIPTDRRIAMYVGRFHTNSAEKGIGDVIAGAPELLRQYPDLYFYFVGGPVSMAESYRATIASQGMRLDRFIFLDKQPVDQVPYFLKAADILLMPFPWTNHYAYYMSPLKLFEYMSAERPIVATDLPCVREILQDKQNALLVKAGDAGAIADGIRTVLNMPELAAAIASQAYRDVAQYTWKKRAEEILRFATARLAAKEPVLKSQHHDGSRVQAK